MKNPRLQKFVKLPSYWIEKENGLRQFTWASGGSDNTAALLALLAIAHRVDEEGVARATYDQLEAALDISRAKLAAGLKILFEKGLLEHEPEGQSTYRLPRYGEQGTGFGQGWGKLPARAMYHDGVLKGFKDFRLRKAVELHAVKIYLLFVARRNSAYNHVVLSWPKISEYSGVPADQIKAATSLLIENRVITVDSGRESRAADRYSQPSVYRIVHVDPHVNNGTTRANYDMDAGFTQTEPGVPQDAFGDLIASETQNVPVKRRA
ncbi:hypothetical protein [Rhizobium sp. WYCCWR 11128]|uniref:hypothetical protein n=1 Tax=Rhizobium sp. WYCCWR 11128 TaxID=2749832 RepID=UPI0015D3080C|nr:hypothetical protein [Rhizobium sp. WYCCWR 11128]NYT30536.1 hypothetical protein [Rhizobium sp. WYCCWR 11128]